MRQLKSFTVEGGGTGVEIGKAVADAVNPFLAELSNPKIESVDINLSGSFHHAVVLMSYDAEQENEYKAKKK